MPEMVRDLLHAGPEAGIRKGNFSGDSIDNSRLVCRRIIQIVVKEDVRDGRVLGVVERLLAPVDGHCVAESMVDTAAVIGSMRKPHDSLLN